MRKSTHVWTIVLNIFVIDLVVRYLAQKISHHTLHSYGQKFHPKFILLYFSIIIY